MNKVFLIFFLFFSVSCKNKNKNFNNTNSYKSERSFQGYITIIFEDAPEPKFLSLKEDQILGGRMYFRRLAFFNDEDGLKKYVEPVSRATIDTITIQTKKEKIEINFSQKKLSTRSFLFFNGDSIVVSYDQNQIPHIKILNRETKEYDYKFNLSENDIIKLSPEDRYFRYLSYPSQKLTKIELDSFWKNEQKKNGKILIRSLKSKKEKLDSLNKFGLMSKEVFTYNNYKILYSFYSFLANEKLLHDNENYQNIELLENDHRSITSIDNAIKLNLTEILNNENLGIHYSFYTDFFEFYYVPKYVEEKTTKITYKFKNFGGTRYEYDVTYDAINEREIFSEEVREYLLFKYMDKIAKELSPEIVNTYYDKFKKNVKNQVYLDVINSKYKIDTLKSNKLVLKNALNKSYFFEDIINENKGKFVYVDFLASWCGPCVKATPEKLKLINDYKNRGIVFISISIDDNEDEWKKSEIFKSLKNTNHNYIVENPILSGFIKENHVIFVPRYFFFGKNGELINSDAPGPNTTEIRKLFDNHIIKQN